MIYSYDLFDTLVTRKTLKPTDIFFILEKKLKEVNAIDDSINFFDLRVEAEIQARKLSPYEEINIYDIYQELNKVLNFSKEKILEIIRVEYEIEFKNLIPIQENSNLILTKREPVIITDTYFEQHFIEKIITQVVGITNYTLFVSSELRLTKKSGNLFKHVLKDLKINAYELCHTGDNYNSDFKVPESLGIHTVYYTKSHLNLYERKINSNSDEVLKYFGTSKNVRLNYQADKGEKALINVSSSIIAPLLFIHVYEILKNANDKGLRRLYFLSRDGQILLKIAKVIQEKHFTSIDCRYLYASRKAWHLAGICNQIDDFSFDWIFYDKKSITLNKIFNRLECNYDYYKEGLLSYGITKKQEEKLNNYDLGTIKNYIKNDEMLRQNIYRNSKDRRTVFMEYLNQEGFFDYSSIGIVDIGWHGRLQYSLSKILHYEKKDVQLHGFYYHLVNNQKYSNNEFLYQFTNRPVNFIPVFESFVYADHGTLLGYSKENNNINPVLKEKVNKALMSWGLDTQQNIVAEFSNQIINSNIKLEESEIKDWTLKNLEYFYRYPTKEIARLYSKVLHDDDPSSSVHESLVPKINIFDYIKVLVLEKPKLKYIWWEASIKLHTPKLEVFLNNLRRTKRKIVSIKILFKNRFKTRMKEIRNS
ncbi:hypothetical protein [Salipaludibacillus aurantiacus]|uniref:Predicted hydrolase, HAD superfamily n=1 Tax=Salipaludibacillus aurantiacus TaxID=1601833 RepID=A0A1H9ULF3_9BACI|nr:hypothetical protein [Salipaludibacillus aurantiacus]SES09957.1 Predicted hydrolase, HAD superfamily [Salipaludibacillus aurantiacus]